MKRSLLFPLALSIVLTGSAFAFGTKSDKAPPKGSVELMTFTITPPEDGMSMAEMRTPGGTLRGALTIDTLNKTTVLGGALNFDGTHTRQTFHVEEDGISKRGVLTVFGKEDNGILDADKLAAVAPNGVIQLKKAPGAIPLSTVAEEDGTIIDSAVKEELAARLKQKPEDVAVVIEKPDNMKGIWHLTFIAPKGTPFGEAYVPCGHQNAGLGAMMDHRMFAPGANLSLLEPDKVCKDGKLDPKALQEAVAQLVGFRKMPKRQDVEYIPGTPQVAPRAARMK